MTPSGWDMVFPDHGILALTGITSQKISFRPRHNLVLDPDGRSVAVQWLGGTFNPLTD